MRARAWGWAVLGADGVELISDDTPRTARGARGDARATAARVLSAREREGMTIVLRLAED